MADDELQRILAATSARAGAPRPPITAAMSQILRIAASKFGSKVRGADQPATPAVPSASGTSSFDLSRSGGVVKPPDEVDPAMKRTPPPSGARMPVIPPPGTPRGDQSVKPK